VNCRINRGRFTMVKVFRLVAFVVSTVASSTPDSAIDSSSLEQTGLLQANHRNEIQTESDFAEKSHQNSSGNVLQCYVVPDREATDLWCQDNCRTLPIIHGKPVEVTINGHPACEEVTSQSKGKKLPWPKTCFCMPAKQVVPVTPSDCKGFAKKVEEDCTDKPLFRWFGHKDEAFVKPSYVTKGKSSLIGFDLKWESELGGNTGECVAYVNKHRTGKKTCTQFCRSHGKTCAWAQDNAHKQVVKFREWLTSKMDHKDTKCTILASERKETKCDTKWITFMCACK